VPSTGLLAAWFDASISFCEMSAVASGSFALRITTQWKSYEQSSFVHGLTCCDLVVACWNVRLHIIHVTQAMIPTPVR
jgi:hypothetical protein